MHIETIRCYSPERVLQKSLAFVRDRERQALVILLVGGGLGGAALMAAPPTLAHAVNGIDLSSALAQGPLFAPSPRPTPLPDVIDTDPSQHPSGKDRNNEPGNSYPQGKSGSNPDGGDSDKPGKKDGDGNNGCGNDNDFSDDNNGNCGGKGKNPPPETVTPGPTVTVTPEVFPMTSPTVSTAALRTPISIHTPRVELPKILPKSGEKNLPWEWIVTLGASLAAAGLKVRGSLRFR